MVKYNHEWFLNRIKEVRPGDYEEYETLDEYKSSREKLKATHKPCGREIYIIPNTFISRGHGCKYCAREGVANKQTKSQEDFLKEVPNNIKVIGDYKGAHKKVKVYCNECGNTFSMIANDLIRRGCSRCLGHHKRTVEDVRAEIEELSNGEYSLVSESYTDPHTPLNVKHNKCKQVYPVTRRNFRGGRRCPYCNDSIGETLVRQFLESSSIEFDRQKEFEGLKLKNNLSYDFYLPEYNLLIEYQGEQHYKPVELFGGENQLKIQTKIDNIKRDYAKENGIKLLEIPYTKRTYKEIKEIIKNHLI